MTVRKFRADAVAAAAAARQGTIPNVTSVNTCDDGEVLITYNSDHLPRTLSVRLLAANVDEYPRPCGFMVFTDDDSIPKQAADILEEVQVLAASENTLTVLQAVDLLSKTLNRKLGLTDSDDDLAEDYGEDDEDEVDFNSYEDADESIEDQDAHIYAQMDGGTSAAYNTALTPAQKQEQRRTRSSLRQLTKSAHPCRVRILSGVRPGAQSHILSMATRIRKFNFSDQVLQAWGLSPSDYLVLLVQINGPFPTMESIMSRPAVLSGMRFRLRSCAKHKPSLAQAMAAFQDSANDRRDKQKPAEEPPSDTPLERIFLSRSFDSFMTDCFVPLLKIREQEGLSWDDAVVHLNKTHIGQETSPPPKRRNTRQGKSTSNNGEHFSMADGDRSVMLISWEFMLQYFINCQLYCLRCHCHIENRIGSLKPFVCSSSLCLFQYIQMGLGPSIEHEILFQPTVVDLLVSFCYISVQRKPHRHAAPGVAASPMASMHSIREFPVGLSLDVPDIFKEPWSKNTPKCVPVQLTRQGNDQVVTLHNLGDCQQLAPGRWFVFIEESWLSVKGVRRESSWSRLGNYQRILPGQAQPPQPSAQHLPVSEDTAAMVHHLGTIVSVDSVAGSAVVNFVERSGYSSSPSAPPYLSTTATAYMSLYDSEFDSLTDDEKARAIRHILNTLPPINSIRSFLKQNPGDLVRQMDGVSPAAVTLLSWIVATNRSVILHIEDDENSPEAPASGSSKGGVKKRAEKIPEMSRWAQFRFAQGDHEKEMRFNAELTRLVHQNAASPTMFAWHGSPLPNWHSIIRNGLDFQEVAHGRAYGNGIYFSNQYGTSGGYSGLAVPQALWPQSELKLQSAIALNELINVPDQFLSRAPHFVVQNVDWQQCRYLLVSRQGDPSQPATAATVPKYSASHYIKQESSLAPRGPENNPIRIPLSAIPSSRNFGPQWRQPELLDLGDDDDSDEDDPADVDFLMSDDEEDRDVILISSDDDEVHNDRHSATKKKGPDIIDLDDDLDDDDIEIIESHSAPAVRPPPSNLTPFTPGLLNINKLPRMAPPQTAGGASKHLAKQVASLRKSQESTPPQQLGWYIDFDRMDNLFQMIIELHSFDLDTPLGKDMARAGASSVVLELRFGDSFPFSPPFVRVLRPRFLPFLEGGGGHVTAGGAMCMEMLTSTGWSPVCTVESVLLQVRMAITATEPAARLDTRRRADYGVDEAYQAYIRSAAVHRWEVPADLMKTIYG